jgi:hypothetical protein
MAWNQPTLWAIRGNMFSVHGKICQSSAINHHAKGLQLEPLLSFIGEKIMSNSNKITVSTSNIKMGNIPSFSTAPGADFGCRMADTSHCDPDKKYRTGGKPCYVPNFAKLRPSVQQSYLKNLSLVDTDLATVERQLSAWLVLQDPAKFRWHVSGDVYSAEYLDMMIRLAQRHKRIKFLCYTKAIRVIRGRVADLPDNLIVYVSAMTQAQVNFLQNDPELCTLPIAYATTDLPDQDNKPSNKARVPGFLNCAEQLIGHERITCRTCNICWSRKNVRFYPH